MVVHTDLQALQGHPGGLHETTGGHVLPVETIRQAAQGAAHDLVERHLFHVVARDEVHHVLRQVQPLGKAREEVEEADDGVEEVEEDVEELKRLKTKLKSCLYYLYG